MTVRDIVDFYSGIVRFSFSESNEPLQRDNFKEKYPEFLDREISSYTVIGEKITQNYNIIFMTLVADNNSYQAKMNTVAKHFEKALIEADADVEALNLEFTDTNEDDYAVITWKGGCKKKVNISGDSPRGMMEDILNNAWR